MQNSLLSKGYPASTNLPAHALVKFTNDGKIATCTSSDDPVIGVCSELAATSGAIVDVIHQGIAEVKLSGSVAIGQFVSPSTNGSARQATSGHRICGQALKAGVNGDIIPVLINPSAY